MANILLVATGGTRAPTQIELAERFTKDGHAVRLIASTNALRFLGSFMARFSVVAFVFGRRHVGDEAY